MHDLEKQLVALNPDNQRKQNRGNLAVSNGTLAGISAKLEQSRGKIMS